MTFHELKLIAANLLKKQGQEPSGQTAGWTALPSFPFGGVKESGLGRELGRHGMEKYLKVKTVQVRVGHTRTPWVRNADRGAAAQRNVTQQGG